MVACAEGRRRVPSIVLASVLSLVICLPALAQGRGGQGARVGMPATANFRAVMAGNSFARGFFLRRSGFGAVAPVTVETLLNGSFPVPGLGFDYAHFAAINQNLGVRALIDPSTQLQLGLARQILRETPVLPFAAPFFAPSSAVILLQQPSPPVIIIQQPPAPVEVEEGARSVRRVEQETVAAQPTTPPEPPRELSEYVLVRRDGSVAFAVGVTTQAGRLVYVTRDGIRRSFPLADLDRDTTLRMNEERGISIRLPD